MIGWLLIDIIDHIHWHWSMNNSFFNNIFSFFSCCCCCCCGRLFFQVNILNRLNNGHFLVWIIRIINFPDHHWWRWILWFFLRSYWWWRWFGDEILSQTKCFSLPDFRIWNKLIKNFDLIQLMVLIDLMGDKLHNNSLMKQIDLHFLLLHSMKMANIVVSPNCNTLWRCHAFQILYPIDHN